jgi:molecular chaperone DnaJ
VKDYYSILGLKPGATEEEIKAQFRKLAKEYHPDAGGDETRFKEIVEAYEALLKGKVDENDLYSGFNPFTDFFNLFRNTVQPLVIKVQVDLLDIINQKPVNVTYDYTKICNYCNGTGASKVQPCPTCHGKGTIIITQGQVTIARTCPACGGRGVIIEEKCSYCNGTGKLKETERIQFIVPIQMNSGETLKFPDKGYYYTSTLRSPLFVNIEILPYNGIYKQDLNLVSEQEISLIDYYKGKCKVQTINGMEEIEVPVSKEPFFTVVRSGKGVNQYGDHIIKFKITIPSKEELLKFLNNGGL